MMVSSVFFFQAEDGIRDLVRSRGLGDVYKRQDQYCWGNNNYLALSSTIGPVEAPAYSGDFYTEILSLIHI